MKKLYRSEKDTIVAGILGGFGEYFDVDPTILRLGFVVLVLITGIFPGVIAYIIAYFIIPDRPEEYKGSDGSKHPLIIHPVEPPISSKAQTEPASESIESEGLKKPNWPISPDSMIHKDLPTQSDTNEPEEIKYPESEIETPSLDSLMEENDVSLDDLIDE
jgi:phage shock protein C